jgi:hypothetical protein
MRNREAGMTGHAHKSFHRQRRIWSVIPKIRLMMAAIVALLAICWGTMVTARAAPQQNETSSNSPGLSHVPTITANPERVMLTNGRGSTHIEWDTGTGSMGFVFLTEDGGKPLPFASGSLGTQLAPWIGDHRYVFELYGDDQRQTLLAKVAVLGSAQNTSSRQTVSWQLVGRWALIIGLAALSYFAVYLSSAGPVRTVFPTEPKTSPRQLHVSRNLLLGMVAFVCVDAAVFHSGVYVSILAPNSYAGRIWRITRAEKQRASSGLKEVLVLGDSRIAEGFSATLANELGSPDGLRFISLAEPAASANTWYYMVREVDPTGRRYAAIVIPYGIGYEPSSADGLRISMTAPLLRYSDCFNFASGFQRWSGGARAFVACILRGSAYQDDVADLLAHPVARMISIRETGKVHARREYKGRDYDLVGTSYDAATGQVTFAPKLTEAQRLAFRKSLIKPSQSDTEYSLKLQRDWIPRIMDRYSQSPTAIVLTPLPRGPYLALGGFSGGHESVLPSSVIHRTNFALPEHTFDFLEQPENYFDAFHLNAKGRQKFTEMLVSEVVGRVRSADSKPQDNSERQFAVKRGRASDQAN